MSTIANPFKNFSASKMSNNPRFKVEVSFKDFMGNQHRIVCNSRKKLAEANEFLKMFKSESVKIDSILREYPVSLGKFPKKFHKEIKSDLQSAGFGSISKYLLK